MNIDPVIILIEKMQQNLRYFNLKVLFKLPLVTSQNIALWD